MLKSHTRAFSVGMAMFSMFFGAGNIVFPLLLGRDYGNESFFAFLGFISTAVLLPLFGVIAMLLYDGNYKTFFLRLGKIPGWLLIALFVSILGPFGASPRIIAVSYATIHLYFPQISLLPFSAAFCILIFLLVIKRSNLLNIMGNILSPILLALLVMTIVFGFIGHATAPQFDVAKLHAVTEGIIWGYNTLDFVAALFYSSIVIYALKKGRKIEGKDPLLPSYTEKKGRVAIALKGGILAAFLLMVIYAGLISIASFKAASLSSVANPAELLGAIVVSFLGTSGGSIVIATLFFACITTVVAEVVVFSDALHYELFKKRMPYLFSIFVTLAISFAFSNLDFAGISKILTPIVEVIYPAAITLAICNVAYKIWGFERVKVPVFVVFAVTLFVFALG
ncbi:branched-chain amino acid transport system II carrier protein [Simkania negevensis]|uniref:Branched-chain amino acid transport system II carrier protein n=1 Tax=Simkania negevensis TaxID=83561 RepID=A0ABS3AUB6_9BACT|nr:branched-chain amino acid transport system II carrier protein [Simkania negevensis]